MQIIGAAFVAGLLMYYLGSWVYTQFNYFMSIYTKYLELHPVKGIFLYMLFFICGMQVFIPPGAFISFTTPTFMAMFGPCEGILLHFAIVFVTEHTGIFVTYFIGRYICRVGDFLARRLEYFDVFNSLVVTKGAKITFLIRLCLIVPYDVVNYVMSTTDISLKDYFIGNNGFIMDFIVSSYIGISVSNVASLDARSGDAFQQIMILSLGVV